MIDQNSALRMRFEGDALIFSASVRGGTSQRIEGSVSGIRNGIGPGYLTEVIVENAIAQIEDFIMPILRGLPANERLEIDGTGFEEVVDLLSDNNQAVISIESVEDLFNQLANHASGSTVAWRQHVPASQVALSLIVLREVMHHGGFSSVSVSHHSE